MYYEIRELATQKDLNEGREYSEHLLGDGFDEYEALCEAEDYLRDKSTDEGFVGDQHQEVWVLTYDDNDNFISKEIKTIIWFNHYDDYQEMALSYFNTGRV